MDNHAPDNRANRTFNRTLVLHSADLSDIRKERLYRNGFRYFQRFPALTRITSCCKMESVFLREKINGKRQKGMQLSI
jgi:hypothetical protein